MALKLTAMVCQFKMPRSLFQVSLMHQPFVNQVHQGSVDGGLVGGRVPDAFGNLLAGQRNIGGKQDIKNGRTRFRPT